MTLKQEAALRLAKELDGVIADVEEGDGFDDVCLNTVKYVRDALAEQPAQQQEPTCKQNLQVWVISNGKGRGQFSWEPQDERYWTRMEPTVKQSLTVEQPAQVAEPRKQQSAERVEPVGVVGTDIGGAHLMYGTKYVGTTPDKKTAIFFKDVPVGSPLYTSPPASKPWVGLEESEWREIDDRHDWTTTQGRIDAAEEIEAKLKEKNT